MSANPFEQKKQLLQKFPNIKCNGDVYYLDTFICGATYTIKISLPRSFPSGPVVAEFTKPVSSNMVAADNKTIVDAQLSNFTGYYWIGDILSNTIANLNRYGVQPRMDSNYMNISGNSSGMPTPNRSPYYSSPPFVAPQPTSQPGETTEMVWNRTLPSLQLDNQSEDVLKQYLSNKDYRSSILQQLPCIMSFANKSQSFGKTITHYEDVVNTYLNLVDQNDTLANEVTDLQNQVMEKKNHIESTYEMYSKEDMKKEVDNRVTELKGILDDLKLQFDNQTIDASEFSNKYLEYSSEMNFLVSCINYCS